MRKTQLALSLALMATVSAQAQALTTGDIAFTSFNADEDSWALVTFVDIAAGTEIYISDNEWNGSSFNDTNEHTLVWNTGAGSIAAGTVITFLEIDDGTPLSASYGSLSLASGGGTNLGFAKSNETVYVYLGSATGITTALTGLTTENDSAPQNLANAGLTLGSNAIALVNDADFGEYVGVRDGLASLADYQPLVFNADNWNDVGSGEFTGTVLNDTAFTAAVPEPETYAMMLAGLGLLGVAARRRGKV
ncbi:MAG: PEP-CTERM sorting domain-containing protein [Pseudomonadota bacterium]